MDINQVENQKNFELAEKLFFDCKYDDSIELLLKLESIKFNLALTYYYLAQNFLHKFVEIKKAYLKSSRILADVKYPFEIRKNYFEKTIYYSTKSLEIYDYNDIDNFFILGEVYYYGGDLASSILNYLRAAQKGDKEAIQRISEIKQNEQSSSTYEFVLSIYSFLPLNQHKIPD